MRSISSTELATITATKVSFALMRFVGLLGTAQVCTPSYRAPEVVMGQDLGLYSATIDMWGAGCIFGELLQRQTVSAGTYEPVADSF